MKYSYQFCSMSQNEDFTISYIDGILSLHSKVIDMDGYSYIKFILLRRSKMTCKWTYDENYYYYETECGNVFQFDSEGIEENQFKYCPYCGKFIEEEKEIDGYKQ